VIVSFVQLLQKKFPNQGQAFQPIKQTFKIASFLFLAHFCFLSTAKMLHTTPHKLSSKVFSCPITPLRE